MTPPQDHLRVTLLHAGGSEVTIPVQYRGTTISGLGDSEVIELRVP